MRESFWKFKTPQNFSVTVNIAALQEWANVKHRILGQKNSPTLATALHKVRLPSSIDSSDTDRRFKISIPRRPAKLSTGTYPILKVVARISTMVATITKKLGMIFEHSESQKILIIVGRAHFANLIWNLLDPSIEAPA